MLKILRLVILAVMMFFLSYGAYAEEISREQIKGLDEQVQDIKGDVIAIAAELNRLEEKLLYPSQTQVAVFVALGGGETFRLDSATIELDGEAVAHHLYTYQELEALRKGGVQRIFTGNIRTGDHALQVSFLGKSEGGGELKKTESYTLHKGVGPSIVDVTLAQQSIAFKDR